MPLKLRLYLNVDERVLLGGVSVSESFLGLLRTDFELGSCWCGMLGCERAF